MPHRLALPAGSVALLRNLLAQLVALHDDPPVGRHAAWDRLYPATTADPRLDRDLRDLVHPDLVEGRRVAFEAVGDILSEVEDHTDRLDLDDEQAVAFLGVVNDIRISLAAAVDLPALLDNEGHLPDSVEESTESTVRLVEWLAYLQEQVLSSVAPESQTHFAEPIHDRDQATGDDERGRPPADGD